MPEGYKNIIEDVKNQNVIKVCNKKIKNIVSLYVLTQFVHVQFQLFNNFL